jgi:hypothetical protein
VTRFTSECELCPELLGEYIAACNEIVDFRKGALSATPPSSRQLALAMIDRAVKRKKQARKKLFAHKEQQH